MGQETRLLHSRYNPQAEADRYIDSLSLKEKVRFFILIEPGQNYLIAPLKKRAPHAKIIALYAEPCGKILNKPAPDTTAPDSAWYPENGIKLTVKTPTELVISGISKEYVGQFAAKVRDLRPVEPYHAYGIRYSDEVVIKKTKKKSTNKKKTQKIESLKEVSEVADLCPECGTKVAHISGCITCIGDENNIGCGYSKCF